MIRHAAGERRTSRSGEPQAGSRRRSRTGVTEGAAGRDRVSREPFPRNCEGLRRMASVTQLPTGANAAANALGLHRRLELDETLAALLADGLLTEADVKRVRADVRTARGRTELHPLTLVANLKLADARHPDKPLSLEVLTQWLSVRAGLPYLKIDPMKIDVAAVTQVVSHAYAQRYRILPVAVSEMQVVFATSEPFDTRWLADLAHILRRDVQRVVANPLDVGRYLTEWWGCSARSSAPRTPRTTPATAARS